MKITAFVLGLVLSLIILGSAFMAGFLSGLGKATNDIQYSQSFTTAGGLGFISAILGLIGSGLVFQHKMASCVLFGIAAFFLIISGATTMYKDMAVFGALLFLPLIFSAVSKEEGKRKYPEEPKRRNKSEECIGTTSGTDSNF
jgi:hypothetical protein